MGKVWNSISNTQYEVSLEWSAPSSKAALSEVGSSYKILLPASFVRALQWQVIPVSAARNLDPCHPLGR